MDGLLPIPQNSSPVEVPVFDDAFEYDPASAKFERFPWSRLDQDAIETLGLDLWDILQTLRPHECANLLQQWLFFGLLAEFFGRTVRAADFSIDGREYPKVLYVHSPYLEDAVSTWQAAARRRQMEMHRASVELLRFAVQQSEVFDMALGEQYDHSVGAISLSVKLLVEFLISINDAAFTSRPSQLLPSCLSYRESNRRRRTLGDLRPTSAMPAATRRTTPAVRLLLDLFTRNGWCQTQSPQICRMYSYATVNYLALMPRELPPSGSHDLCLQHPKCVAFNLDRESDGPYRTKHVSTDCTCASSNLLSYIEPLEIHRIIQRGGIPVIAMDMDDPNPQIYITELDNKMHYFAISHVWSDGLGNEVQNGIRPCQVARLKKILREAQWFQDRYRFGARWQKWAERGGIWTPLWRLITWSPEKTRSLVYFWLDTFCIPTGDHPDIHDLKMKAIKHITPIFGGASAVIVLDSEMERMGEDFAQENGNTEDEVVAARVLASKWMQRAWTLEEGSLARTCFFGFGSTLHILGWSNTALPPLGRRIHESTRLMFRRWASVSASDLARTRFRDGLSDIVANILLENRKKALSLGSKSQRSAELKKNRLQMFVNGWNNLLQRNATKPRDLLMIFANMLDFNASSIARLDVDQRLVAIVRSCEQLPLSLLYKCGTTLGDFDALEDSWIPTSLEGLGLHTTGVMQRTKLGLEISTTRAHPEDVKIWATEFKIPWEAAVFRVWDKETGSEYVVERKRHSASEDGELYTKMQSFHDGATSSYMIMDFRDGTRSIDGYRGWGALLNHRQGSPTDYYHLVRFESSVRFWTPEQWRSNPSSSLHDWTSMPYYAVRSHPNWNNCELILETAPSKWNSRFPQRPLYVRPLNIFLNSQIIAILSSFLGFHLILQIFFPDSDTREDHPLLYMLVREGILLGASTFLIMFWQLRARRSYRNWLHTFDEDWRPDEERKRAWVWGLDVRGWMCVRWVRDRWGGWRGVRYQPIEL